MGNNRSLKDYSYPFLIIDGLVLKAREDGKVRALSLLVGVGINEKGQRETLGLKLGDSESESSWTEFFSWLKNRGLRGIDLVISDHHGGLYESFQTVNL